MMKISLYDLEQYRNVMMLVKSSPDRNVTQKNLPGHMSLA